jgi:hypothetical protein
MDGMKCQSFTTGVHPTIHRPPTFFSFAQTFSVSPFSQLEIAMYRWLRVAALYCCFARKFFLGEFSILDWQLQPLISPFFGSFESPFRRTWFIVAGDAATNISGFMKSSMLNPSLSEGNFFRSGTD